MPLSRFRARFVSIAHVLKSRKKAISRNAELVKRESSLERLAKYDILTGLPNRLLLNETIGLAVANANSCKSEFALFFIDLDGFKLINDSFGHATGDALLVAVAQLFKECVRKQDTVARLAGDEFVILIEGIDSRFTIESVSAHIISKLALLKNIGQNKIKVSPSIGVAIYPRHTKDRNELIKLADSAMYEAKRTGKNKFVIATA